MGEILNILNGFECDLAKNIATAVAEDEVEVSPMCAAFVKIVTKALKQTHQEWATRVDKLCYRKLQSRFLKNSPVYKYSVLHLEQFISEHFRRLYDDFVFEDYKRQTWLKLDLAAHNISENIEVLAQKSNCWECLNTCENLKTCSSCGVAKYCKCMACEVVETVCLVLLTFDMCFILWETWQAAKSVNTKHGVKDTTGSA